MLTPVPDSAFLREAKRGLAAWRPFEVAGRVRSVVGLLVEVEGLRPSLGAFCAIETESALGPLEGEVVGLRDTTSLVMPFGELRGIKVGARVRIQADVDRVPTGIGCLGRVLDALGRPIDGKGPLVDVGWRPIEGAPIGTVTRTRIAEPLDLGLRALNVFATVGRGMRIGIFAGSGVGKSTLLGQIARGTDADVSVIALIGERGREVREFIDDSLGPEGLARSVVVVSTGDESPLMRVRAARFACAAAEYFRDAGRDVLLMMDSVTRYAHAQRQIGLSVGEPPASKGYTPSVFTNMAVMLERAGAVETVNGSPAEAPSPACTPSSSRATT
jgi:flagellum-specific ATP synthase